MQEAQELCLEAAVISERLEPSEALPKINVDASFVSEMASRALEETPSHSHTRMA